MTAMVTVLVCSLSLALFAALYLASFILGMKVLDGLSMDDAVNVPRSGQVMHLEGVPGEQIRLRLFRLKSDVGVRSTETRVRFEQPGKSTLFETPAETSWQEGHAIAKFRVPVLDELPDDLSGTLFGEVVFDDESSRNLEIPFHLRVDEAGHISTSGSDNALIPRWIGIALTMLWFYTAVPVALAPFFFVNWLAERTKWAFFPNLAGNKGELDENQQ